MADEIRRTTEHRLRAAVESSPSGLLMIDPSGLIVLVNQEVERLFGYPREELLGKPVDILVPSRFRGAHPGFRTAFFQSPKVRSMGAGRDLFGLRKDGTEVPVEIGLTPVVTEEGLFVLSAIVDISARKKAEEERRKLEEQLRQAQKMEAIGVLAGGIAHDFNNILGAVIGYAELLQGRAKEAVDRTDLDELLRAAQRGKQVIQRILRLSRRQETERRPIALEATIQEAVSLLRSTLPAPVELRVFTAPDAPRVLADTTGVHQVLLNLATNASHAMPHGGALEIRLEPFYVRDGVARANPDLREGPHALLTVRDTGAGMPPEVLERAFEPFFTTKAAGAGSGLGLAMVRGLMRDHGGTALIESRLGEGTTVLCYFPAIAGVSADEVPAIELDPAASGRGERILYVDDQPSLAEVGVRRLESLGYLATPFTSPAKALDVFRADPAAWDLVLTDYSMPGMTGLDLAAEITRARPGMPVIMMTGWTEDLSDERVAAAGVRRLVQKPVALGELGEAVASWVLRTAP